MPLRSLSAIRHRRSRGACGAKATKAAFATSPKQMRRSRGAGWRRSRNPPIQRPTGHDNGGLQQSRRERRRVSPSAPTAYEIRAFATEDSHRDSGILRRFDCGERMPHDWRAVPNRTALGVGQCTLDWSVPRNGEGPGSVRSDVAASSQAGVERTAYRVICAIGFDLCLINVRSGQLSLCLDVAGGAVIQPLLLGGLIITCPAHGSWLWRSNMGRRGGASTDERCAKCNSAHLQRSKHPPTFLPGFPVQGESAKAIGRARADAPGARRSVGTFRYKSKLPKNPRKSVRAGGKVLFQR